MNKDIKNNIINFYKKDYNNLVKLLEITVYKNNIPLRLIEWFVTNYTKKNKISYKFYDKINESYTQVDVYNSYKIQLQGYGKELFDPFCRGSRIVLSYIDIDTQQEKEFTTAYKQLNFFKWVIENKIIDYIKKHYEEIYTDMNINNRNRNYTRNKSLYSVESSDTMSGNSIKKKKSELSTPSYISFSVTNNNEIELLNEPI